MNLDVWAGLNLLKIGSIVELLWTRQWLLVCRPLQWHFLPTYFVCHTRTHGTHCARTKHVPIVLPALIEAMSSLGGYNGWPYAVVVSLDYSFGRDVTTLCDWLIIWLCFRCISAVILLNSEQPKRHGPSLSAKNLLGTGWVSCNAQGLRDGSSNYVTNTSVTPSRYKCWAFLRKLFENRVPRTVFWRTRQKVRKGFDKKGKNGAPIISALH